MIPAFSGCTIFRRDETFCMTKSGASGADTPGSAGKADRRKARLAEELRANLQRRKAQARSRRTGGGDEPPAGRVVVGAGKGSPGTAENDNEPTQKEGKT
jgi:hypothetical protein